MQEWKSKPRSPLLQYLSAAIRVIENCLAKYGSESRYLTEVPRHAALLGTTDTTVPFLAQLTAANYCFVFDRQYPLLTCASCCHTCLVLLCTLILVSGSCLATSCHRMSPHGSSCCLGLPRAAPHADAASHFLILYRAANLVKCIEQA